MVKDALGNLVVFYSFAVLGLSLFLGVDVRLRLVLFPAWNYVLSFKKQLEIVYFKVVLFRRQIYSGHPDYIINGASGLLNVTNHLFHIRYVTTGQYGECVERWMYLGENIIYFGLKTAKKPIKLRLNALIVVGDRLAQGFLLIGVTSGLFQLRKLISGGYDMGRLSSGREISGRVLGALNRWRGRSIAGEAEVVRGVEQFAALDAGAELLRLCSRLFGGLFFRLKLLRSFIDIHSELLGQLVSLLPVSLRVS